MADIKISQLTAKGTSIASTDLIEISESNGAGGYVTKSVTGANIIGSKQDTLVSGTNIKTLNSNSILGSGDLEVQPTLISGTNIKTIEGQSILGGGNINITNNDVGLGNVDDTSDLNKPISTATQTALNAKQNTITNSDSITQGAINLFLTTAERTKLTNTSGTNTGDQTNITGNAATVTTNANLTGVVTSTGNTTAIADNALSIAKTSGLQGAIDLKQDLSSKNAANGYAGLDASSKINPSQLPSIAITDTFVVINQAAQLALTAEVGDVAVRTDLNKSFILKTSPASTFANWQELLTPTDSVSSVFGRTGVVTAQNGDYTASQVGAPSGSGTSTGTNTGDNATNSQYSGLVSNATHTGDATGNVGLTVKGINGTILSTLGTGILKNTTGTGVPSIAVAADFPTLNQNTTGNAATVTTNANLTGDITSIGNATSIAAGVIVDADISATAGITDNKLADIGSAGKVKNSATTATASNNVNTIVLRDASNNFSAGTITANLTGTASGNLVSGGALGTPSSGSLLHTTGYLANNLSGIVPVANGGTGTATPSLVAGTNVTITGTFPNQTIAASGGGGSMAIGGSITSATAGSVLFAGTSGVLQQDNAKLFWDDTNNRLGIGTVSPTANLQVAGTTFLNGGLDVGDNAYYDNSVAFCVKSNRSFIFNMYDASANIKMSLTQAGSLGLGILTPNTSSILDLTSTTKGFLIPRMTTTQRDAIATPATGLQIYNTTTNANNYYNGSAWVSAEGGGGVTQIVAGTNVTISPAGGTGVVTINASGGGGGAGGVHQLTNPISNVRYSGRLSGGALFSTAGTVANKIILGPFIPANSITIKNLITTVNGSVVGGLFRFVIYSNLNGVPSSKLLESTDIDGSTNGDKTFTTSFTFTAGTTYWLGIHSNALAGVQIPIYSDAQAVALCAESNYRDYQSRAITVTYPNAPATLGATTLMLSAPYSINFTAL